MTGLVLAILFALAWVPLFAYRTEMIQQAMPFYSADERRWIRLTPTIVAIHATLSCIVVSLSEPPAWRVVLSVAVLTGGVVFWFWARAQIGPLRVTRMPDEPPHVLRRDGAFGLVRNPLTGCWWRAPRP
jgi:protein-S-isoprenylcysteine O-methyltransferase Ste14